MTWPAKINHVIAKYIELYFTSIFSSKRSVPLLKIAEESPLNSAVVVKILLCQYKMKKSEFLCSHGLFSQAWSDMVTDTTGIKNGDIFSNKDMH